MGKFFYYRSIQKFINVFLVVLVVILFGSCATNPNNPGKPYPNRPPLTALANVPPPTIVYEFGTAKVSLSWNGTDPDGFVTAYHFRWVTYQPSETSATSWRTILNTSFSGLLHRTFVPEVQEISHNASSVPNIYHYLSTLTGSSADSVITLLDSGKTLFLFGDSVSMANVKEFQNSNKGTFIFDSRDSSNIHEFQIKAVDNKGIESISPAAVRFGTPQIFPPDTRVNSTSAVTVSTVDSSHVDSLGHTIYDRLTRRYERTIHPMLPYLTATYLGLPFAYVGSDSLSPELMFQWNVDGKFQGNPGWSPYSMQTDALITALACDSLNNGWFDTTRYHYFTVRAKSQFELVDPTPDTIFFRMTVPDFVRGIKHYLLLDNTDSLGNLSDTTFVKENPTPKQRMDYFRSNLNSIVPSGTLDTFRVGPKVPFPSLFTLSKYNAVVLTNEKKVRGRAADLTKKLLIKSESIRAINDYLKLGGKLITSGWDLYGRIYSADTAAEFYNYELHLQSDTSSEYITARTVRDFIGASGGLGYPDIIIDTAKIVGGAMDSIMTGTLSFGLGEQIYTFNSMSNTIQNHRTLGVRYIGPTYKVVHLGFPLYYIAQPSGNEAETVLRKAFQDIQELP